MPEQRSTTARGYGAEHQRVRAQWAKAVAAGTAECHARICLHATRAIDPDEAWDLGHNESRTTWTGPEHVKCNRTEGARHRDRDRPFLTSRNW